VGNSVDNYVKIDLMYADQFIHPIEMIDDVRMASVDDIIAMKMNVISRGGRKKDFWDIHYLLDLYSLPKMLELHKKRHPWEHEDARLLDMLTEFNVADEMTDPKCLLGKDWDFIKMDIIDAVSKT
jgi:predicted nucleotidyltransferase component of viral defense system